MQLRKTQIRVSPIRATLWTVVLLVLLAVILQKNPVTLKGELATSEGTELTIDADADVVVVLDYQAIRQSGDTFSGRDFSAAWIDMFQREIGPVSVATPETLTEDHLEDARIVVLTHSVGVDMPAGTIERVRERVLGGAVVVVDRPEGRLRELFSANGGVGSRPGDSITHAEGLEAPFGTELEQMPLLTDYVGSTAPREDANTLLAIDGAPAIYATGFGDGTAVTVDFDITRQLVSLRQGRPDEDFTVRPDDTGRRPRTADLVADQTLVGAAVPYADLLERFFVYGVLMRYARIPALWSYPEFKSGAVLMAHEDTRLGDRAAWTSEYEHRRQATSTLLSSVDAGLTSGGAEQLAERGARVGLAWRLPHPELARYRPIGIGPFAPMRKPLDLRRQRRAISEVLPDQSVITARSVRGTWTSDWSAPLGALAANGIRADLSYATDSTRGYAFGTGRPFLALNNQGIPLRIREYPLVVPPGADSGPEIERLLARSAGGHHQVLTVASRPSQFADYPDVAAFGDWIDMFDSIEQHDHLAMTPAGYRHFQQMRRGAELRSRFEEMAPLPEELRTEETAPDHTGHLIRLVVDVPRGDLHVIVPDRVGDRDLLGVIEGTQRVGDEIVTTEVETDPASLVGFSFRRIGLDQGTNVLEAYYR